MEAIAMGPIPAHARVDSWVGMRHPHDYNIVKWIVSYPSKLSVMWKVHSVQLEHSLKFRAGKEQGGRVMRKSGCHGDLSP